MNRWFASASACLILAAAADIPANEPASPPQAAQTQMQGTLDDVDLRAGYDLQSALFPGVFIGTVDRVIRRILEEDLRTVHPLDDLPGRFALAEALDIDAAFIPVIGIVKVTKIGFIVLFKTDKITTTNTEYIILCVVSI